MKFVIKKKVITITAVLLGSFLLAYPPIPLLHAVDCSSVREELDQLKSVIKRRGLLQKAIQICPDDPQINYFYAYNLERLLKYHEALRYYEIAGKLDPSAPKVFWGIGDANMGLGKFHSAIEAYEKGLRLVPGDIRAQKLLAKARRQIEAQASEGILAEKAGIVLAKKEMSSQKKPLDQTGKKPPWGRKMNIFFPNGSNNLTNEEMEKLDNVCKILQREQLRYTRFEIAGHSDSSGDFDNNLNLSKLRSLVVRDYLIINCNIDQIRLRVVYYGEKRPGVPNNTKRNRQLNRRVEIRQLP
jgi:outer membrane protein OmpA-like peptidoglycan-associated protein